MDEEREYQRKRGLDRIINLSDAVVAIAATLLILPLVDSAKDVVGLGFAELVRHEWRQFFVFVLSFAVIVRFWREHHQLFQRIGDYTTTLIWTNSMWLLSIAFLPFPTELLASTGESSTADVGVYIATMVVTTGATLASVWEVIRRPELLLPNMRETLSLIPAATATVVMVVAFVIATMLPAVGVWALLLVAAIGPLTQLIMRRRPRRS